MDLLPGQRVADRYVLRGVLGQGGMGTVVRAEDELLDREVAIKDVEIPLVLDLHERSVTRERVLREARAAARLNHPGAVTVYDAIDEVVRVHIVMELVRAPDLAALVAAEGPLPPHRVARIGRQMVDVLEAAHAAGIVHRDVKPANVMVLPGDQVKVTDFGIASVPGDPELTLAGTVLGSPSYMAPEQAVGARVGPAADLWSLGATLYFAVEGRPPFAGDDPRAVLAAVTVGNPEPPRHAGPLAPVLLALLTRRPEDRPVAADVRDALDEVIAAGTAADAGEPAGPAIAALPHRTPAPTGPAGPATAPAGRTRVTPVAPRAGHTRPVELAAAAALTAPARRSNTASAIAAWVIVAVLLAGFLILRSGIFDPRPGTGTGPTGSPTPAATATAPATGDDNRGRGRDNGDGNRGRGNGGDG